MLRGTYGIKVRLKWVWVGATDARVIILARVPDPIINKRTLNLELICLLIAD